jgi:hypothetical protein
MQGHHLAQNVLMILLRGPDCPPNCAQNRFFEVAEMPNSATYQPC